MQLPVLGSRSCLLSLDVLSALANTTKQVRPRDSQQKQWQALLPPSLFNTIYLLQPYQTEHLHHDGILSHHNATLRQESRLEIRR
jgi:hypothetical protein